MDENKENIVLTGFGLFRTYKINPSWEAIKLLDEKKFPNYNIIKLQIPVIYKDVEQIVQEIWQKYRPKLVIHCGVSCLARCLHLESRAVLNKQRYCQMDITECLPKLCNNNCDDKELNYIYTKLDLQSICNEFNKYYYYDKENNDNEIKDNEINNDNNRIEIPAKISDVAGEFLCEYIYRCSLLLNNRQTLFIHVPECNNFDFKLINITKCLELLIKIILNHIDNNDKSDKNELKNEIDDEINDIKILNNDENQIINNTIDDEKEIF